MSEVFTEKVAFKRKQKSLQGKVEIGHAANEAEELRDLKVVWCDAGAVGRGWAWVVKFRGAGCALAM